MSKIVKNVAICLLAALTAVLLGNTVAREARINHIKGHVETMLYLKDCADTSSDPAAIAANMDYILTFSPNRDGKSHDADFALLIDAFTERTLGAMMDRMRHITGRDLGQDPRVWIKAYAADQKTVK